MEYLNIAKIINFHGVKGELKLLLNHYGKNFDWKKGDQVFLKLEEGYKSFTIENYRFHKNYLLLSFKNLNNINLVLFMKNHEIFIDKDNFNKENNSIYENLIGFKCIDASNKSEIGYVNDLVDNNYQGIWEIICTDNKVVLVPNHGDFINKINKEEKMVYINFIPGMLD